MADVLDSALDERGGGRDLVDEGSSPSAEKLYSVLSISALDKAYS